jgi:acyl transferase domain-containing protein
MLSETGGSARLRSPHSDSATLEPAGDPSAELGAIPAPQSAWSHELFVWRDDTPQGLLERVRESARGLAAAGAGAAEVSCRLWREASASGGRVALAVVAASIDDLLTRLPAAIRHLESGRLPLHDPSGIAAGTSGDGAGKVAFLFPGQGSQYPGMLRDLVESIPEARAAFEQAGRALAGRFDPPVMGFVFPQAATGSEREQQAGLTRTDRAQPALGAAGMAVCRALRLAGVVPDMAGGHSYGEYVALCAAGVLDEAALARLSEARGRSILDAARADLGTMAAVAEGPERIAALLAGELGVTLANLNGPRQTVLSGARAAIERAMALLEARGVGVRPIPVGCAFHSPLMAPARDLLAAALEKFRFAAPRLPVYANSTGEPHAAEGAAIAAVLKEHLVRPVRFGDEIEAMYRDGARVFVEAGSKNVLTGLVRQILGARPHLAVACDLPGRGSLPSFLLALGQLWTAGAPVDLEGLFRARGLAAQPVVAGVTPRRAVPTAAQAEAMAMFQETMRQFLETQRAVMTGFLTAQGEIDNRDARPSPAAPLRPPMPAPASPVRPAAHAAIAAPAAPPRAPIAAAPPAPVAATPAPIVIASAPPPAPAPAAARPARPAAGAAARPLVDVLLEIAGDRTGYPPEMLGLDANLEADLGIDSIKRVEIIAAFRRAVLPSMGEPPASFMERVTAAKTLRQIVAEVSGLAEGAP